MGVVVIVIMERERIWNCFEENNGRVFIYILCIRCMFECGPLRAGERAEDGGWGQPA